MSHIKHIMWLLVTILVCPVMVCGVFVSDCECSRTTYVVTELCSCSGDVHEHEVPAEHHCRHEEYTIQTVSTQVNVPGPQVVAVQAQEEQWAVRDMKLVPVRTAMDINLFRPWGPPDVLSLPLLI